MRSPLSWTRITCGVIIRVYPAMNLSRGRSSFDCRKGFDDGVVGVAPAGTSHESPGLRFGVCPSSSRIRAAPRSHILPSRNSVNLDNVLTVERQGDLTTVII